MLTLDANVWIAAFDPHDRFHDASRDFLAAGLEQGLSFTGPAFVLVEAACAVARRAQDARAGRTDLFLRSGDALYAAAAERTRAPLVSWDDELLRRAGAVTPATWLKEHS